MGTTFKDITNVLRKGADAFRGTVDSANYKDYVLAMLAFKCICDNHVALLFRLSCKMLKC